MHPFYASATLPQGRVDASAQRARLVSSRPTAVPEHIPPTAPRRRTLQVALCATDARQAARGARPLLEFIDAQERLACAPSRTRRRTRAERERDDRLWLDADTYVAWTIDGELVAVVERDPAQSRWCHRITRLSDEQRRLLFSFNRFVPTVIALYRGDRLGDAPITRFLPHFDIATAHRAARRREEDRMAAAARAAAAERAPSLTPRPNRAARPLKKSRFHPEGNFVLIAAPPPDSGLPDYAVVLPTGASRFAHATKRQAERAARRLRRQGLTDVEFTPARVLGAVEVEPVFRKGIKLPRSKAERLELIRREPRIVLPGLRAAWLPRYVETDDGEWVQQEFRNRRTVRTRHHEKLLVELGEVAEIVAELIQAAELRERLGVRGPDVVPELEAASRVALRAQRRLPEAWLDDLGLDRETIAPDWRDLAGRRCARPDESGHWLRAPCEFGRAHPDGLRSRVVELRIDDLAGLMEVAGWRPEFWLIKSKAALAPEWVAPTSSHTALLTAPQSG